jgi:hypothetical protein
MNTALASVESFGALVLCVVATSYVFLFSGCTPMMDLETARNEAQYMPAEIAATLALGVHRAQDYGTHGAAVHSSYDRGMPITQDGCINIDRTDDLALDGVGQLVYDFRACGSQAGQVIVSQTVTIELPDGIDPDNFTDENSNGIPDDLEDASADGHGSEVTSTVDLEVAYNGYREGLLHMSGTMILGGGRTTDESATPGGVLAADLRVSALDYATSVVASGAWSVSPANPDAQLLSFTGSFASATGLQWEIVAHNIEMTPGCNDAMGGQLTARYSGEAGNVEVIALFDNLCDGCAQLIIDGVDQGQTCFPESPLLQNTNEEEGA